jgi:acyl transferase domain-containing protein/NADPH:quinone reductase-like Zn-dependent oxidoreductase/acyl carrier protein
MTDSAASPDRIELLKTAYRKVAELRGQLAAVEQRHNEPVAIVGMGCRMPGGAEDPEAFWQTLVSGTDGTREIPIDRWDIDQYYDPDPDAPNKMYVRRGGFINNIRGFDPLFFHVSPIEAASMDPQQRILLEVTWEALEHAGWAPDRLAGSRTGVFVGLSGSDFTAMILRSAQSDVARPHMATGISPSITAGHISYFLGLRGPCMALDTACSSALTAIHTACDSLRRGESSAAIAGAVNLVISPDGNVLVCKARMLAPDGHCKTFDASADGYTRSEGCGVLILKLLSQAQADGDRILGIIRGSACNQDGRTNGITAPNGNAQREVIQAAQAAAQVTPADISYVETHGTGTALGDPIEVQALGEVFGQDRENELLLGAVKSNVGHLECTAGMAGIIKAALVLQKGEVPPNLHFQTPNPLIAWDRLPFIVPTKRTPLPASSVTRKAGLSAFGFSGTNVHIILEEPPVLARDRQAADRGRHLLILSGQTPKALSDLAARYVSFFDQTRDDLGDLCFTAAVGRSHFAHRLAIAADSVHAMRAKLTDYLVAPERLAGWVTGSAPSRSPGLGLILGSVPAATDAHLNVAGSAYAKALNDGKAAAEALGRSVADAELAVPFMRCYAAAVQWLDWGVAPVAITGSGISLIAAAVVAGGLSLADGLRLALDTNAHFAWSTPQIPLLAPATGLLVNQENLSTLIDVQLAPLAATEAMTKEGAGIILSLADAEAASEGSRVICAAGDGWNSILDAIGALYAAGIAIDWTQFDAPWSRRRVTLPTYPFQRQDCWMDFLTAKPTPASTIAKSAVHPLLGHRVHAASFGRDVVFETRFTPDSPALLEHHKFYATIVVSMTTLLEMATVAGRIALGGDAQIENIVVEQPLLVPVGQARLVQTILSPDRKGFAFSILSADPATLEDGGSWDQHCTGYVADLVAPANATIEPDAVLGQFSQTVDPDWFYETVAQSGVEYGPSFRAIETAACEAGSTFAKLTLPADWSDDVDDYLVHPGLLDAAIQAFGLGASTSSDDLNGQGRAYMPISIERYSLAKPAGRDIWCHTTVRPQAIKDPNSFTGDVTLYSPGGEPIGAVSGVLFRLNSQQSLARKIDERRLAGWLYETRWERLPDQVIDQTVSGQRWLLLDGDPDMTTSLADRIRHNGGEPIIASTSGCLASSVIGQVDHGPRTAAVWDHLLGGIKADGLLDGIAYLAGSDADTAATTSAHNHALNLLDLIHSLARHDITALSGLALVTRGFKTPSIAYADALGSSAVWGTGRVIANELSGLNCRLYDIDEQLNPQEAAEQLVSLLNSNSPENQISLDPSGHFGLRLARSESADTPDGGLKPHAAGPIQLDIGERGDLRHLRFVSQDVPPPGPGDVQLRLLATAMNFRDVLNVLGMYPGDPGNPGVECVGEIVALGEGVEGVSIGDHVIAIPRQGYCTYANAPMSMVFRRPDHLSVAESATLLVAYLTATYALNHLGHMTRGERVLIHAGAGGVGLAAIQLAQRAGAEVFATAGSAAKRDYLKRIGVDHVMDSRSLDFAERIKTLTNGEGIDLVLNSVTGPAMAESLKLLRAGGRFMEIGRTDVFTPAQAHAINPLARHDVIELLEPFQDEPALMQALFDDIRDGLATGSLRPLPYRSFGLDETPQAFRYMSAARHIGKIVVVDRSAPSHTGLEGSGTYLVTGGLSGLGLACAQWLAQEGARSIVLVGRRAATADALAIIQDIEATGATVHVHLADIADRQQVCDLLAATTSPASPLRGIIHSAGVIDDGVLSSQDHDRFETVMRPKVDGAWNLHELTLKTPLEFFVLFSSGAGLFGNPGQSSYAAASVFLDALACARQNAGLPAMSIDWGPWSKIGMAARMDARHAKDWETRGLQAIEPSEGLTLLQRLLRLNRHDQVAVLPMDPASTLQSDDVSPFLSGLITRKIAASSALSGDHAAARFEAAASEDRAAVLVEIISDMVIDIFGLDPSRTLTLDQNLTELGMDSLMAIQLSNRLKTAFSVAMPATLAFQHPTVGELADFVLEKMPNAAGSSPTDGLAEAGLVKDAIAAPLTVETNAETLLANMNELDESDIESLLEAMEQRVQPG